MNADLDHGREKTGGRGFSRWTALLGRRRPARVRASGPRAEHRAIAPPPRPPSSLSDFRRFPNKTLSRIKLRRSPLAGDVTCRNRVIVPPPVAHKRAPTGWMFRENHLTIEPAYLISQQNLGVGRLDQPLRRAPAVTADRDG
jgi:hypothetical protein